MIREKVSQILNEIKHKYLAGDTPDTTEMPPKQEVNLNPIFVFQMGRVGSKSLQSSLLTAYQALSMDIPVFHAHYMNNYEEIEARARHDLPDPSQFIRDLQLAKELRKTLVENQASLRLKIICLVRDIIARNVSTFFYALPQFIPDWEKRLNSNSLTVDYLHEVYLSRNSYKLTALNWFDEQLQPEFNIDVYGTPFPKEVGYKIYSSPKADLLILRLESLNDCVEQAIKEFLGLRNFKLLKVNTGDERETGKLQRLFKRKPLPLEYVKSMYSTKIARHFYTDAELDAGKRGSGLVSCILNPDANKVVPEPIISYLYSLYYRQNTFGRKKIL